jgi:hypothetical protein
MSTRTAAGFIARGVRRTVATHWSLSAYALNLLHLHLLATMTGRVTVQDESKDSLIQLITTFTGATVDNTNMSLANVEALLVWGPQIRGYLAGFGMPFPATERMEVEQLLTLVPRRLSSTILHIPRVPNEPEHTRVVASNAQHHGITPRDTRNQEEGWHQEVHYSHFATKSRTTAYAGGTETDSGTPTRENPTWSSTISRQDTYPVCHDSPFGSPIGVFPCASHSVNSPDRTQGMFLPTSYVAPRAYHTPSFAIPAAFGHFHRDEARSNYAPATTPIQGRQAAPQAFAPMSNGRPRLIETRVVTVFGHRQEMTHAELDRQVLDFLIQLNCGLFSCPRNCVTPRDTRYLAKTAWDGSSVYGLRFLIESTQTIVARDSTD